MTTTEQLAKGAMRIMKDPEAEICDNMFIPFQLLYCELIKGKVIPPLAELPEAKKLEYWNRTKNVVAGGVRLETKRIWVAQALYVYELITKE